MITTQNYVNNVENLSLMIKEIMLFAVSLVLPFILIPKEGISTENTTDFV